MWNRRVPLPEGVERGEQSSEAKLCADIWQEVAVEAQKCWKPEEEALYQALVDPPIGHNDAY